MCLPRHSPTGVCQVAHCHGATLFTQVRCCGITPARATSTRGECSEPADGDDGAMNSPLDVIAHRGWSGRHPEQTRGAYAAAIALAQRTGTAVGLECDVRFSADGHLICLHDASLQRTAGEDVEAIDLTLAELRSRSYDRPDPEEPPLVEVGEADRALVTLSELFDMVEEARADGVDVRAVVETKHPNPRDAEVEEALVALLRERDWTTHEAPVRMLSFSAAAVQRMAHALPAVARTHLTVDPLLRVEDPLSDVAQGSAAVGPALAMLRADPSFIERAHAAGREVHVWTVNDPDDIAWCVEHGVDVITSDHPDRVLQLLGKGSDG